MTSVFDAAWYLAANPDVAAADVDPLAHWRAHGEAEGRAPCPGLDPLAYRRAFAVPPATSVLDDVERRLRLPARESGVDPRWYLRRYPDVAAAGLPALHHYLLHGHREGRLPRPAERIIAASTLFDANWCLTRGPDVRAAGIDPLRHFCTAGWREGRRPNPYFDPLWYAATNPARHVPGFNPLAHYILSGEAAGVRPIAWFDPAFVARQDLPVGEPPLAAFLAQRRAGRLTPVAEFDPGFYRLQLAPSPGAGPGPGRDPFQHYLRVGRTSDIRPSSRFDAAQWRALHMPPRHGRPPVEADNPLVHYLLSRPHPAGTATGNSVR